MVWKSKLFVGFILFSYLIWRLATLVSGLALWWPSKEPRINELIKGYICTKFQVISPSYKTWSARIVTAHSSVMLAAHSSILLASLIKGLFPINVICDFIILFPWALFGKWCTLPTHKMPVAIVR
jgi:hypothetical protein